MIKIVTLNTAVSATTNAAVTYQMPVKMRLDTCFAAMHIVSTAGATGVDCVEFSLQSTGQQATNDAVGVLFTFRLSTNLLAAAVQSVGQNFLLTPLGIQFSAGDRIYINTACTALGSAARTFTLVFNA